MLLKIDPVNPHTRTISLLPNPNQTDEYQIKLPVGLAVELGKPLPARPADLGF
jgi:hypothetical protein